MPNTNEETLKYRVAQLEKKADCYDDKIDKILQNHLPHIQQEVSNLKTRIDVLTVINIGAIIVAILINKYL